jgi:hypothetical protein
MPGRKPQRKTAVEASRPIEPVTLSVKLISGPMLDSFRKKNKTIRRVLLCHTEHTLEILHDAIYEVFERFDPHLYEFQLDTKKPFDKPGRIYTINPKHLGPPVWGMDPPSAGYVNETTLGALGLKPGDTFLYWFDFGDDWWHEIEVLENAPDAPAPGLPLVQDHLSKGDIPPQYLDDDY